MALQDVPPKDHFVTDRSLNKKQHADKQSARRFSRKKTALSAHGGHPECVMIAGDGSCPEWEQLLVQYPMIDSVQREDFPEHGASFTYLAHFYRTEDPAEEGSRAQEEFERFFRAIGYEYDYAGNYEYRWFEGVGVKISSGSETGTGPVKKRAD